MAEETRKQINVDFTNFDELLADLDRMAVDDGMNRSQLVRKLVRQEKARRTQEQLPLPAPKKSTEGHEAVAA